MTKKDYKTFDEVMPKIAFHTELPKMALKDALDKKYLISDASIVKDYESKFGTSDFALLLIVDVETGEEYTTLCGGQVVVKKIQYALDHRLLPLSGILCKPGEYYDIV